MILIPSNIICQSLPRSSIAKITPIPTKTISLSLPRLSLLRLSPSLLRLSLMGSCNGPGWVYCCLLFDGFAQQATGAWSLRHEHTYMYVYVYIYIYIYTYIRCIIIMTMIITIITYICVYIYIYIMSYVYTHTHINTMNTYTNNWHRQLTHNK